jgi:hypothetical protein
MNGVFLAAACEMSGAGAGVLRGIDYFRLAWAAAKENAERPS